MNFLRFVVKSKYMNFFLGFCLLAVGGLEIYEEFAEAELSPVGAHHGITLIAVMHILNGLVDFVEGTEELVEVEAEDAEEDLNDPESGQPPLAS